MTARLNAFKAAPDLMKSWLDFGMEATKAGLEHNLQELVKIRASQINGCAFCIEMHTREARVAGETELRLYMLDAWRDSTLYSERERAALAWTEALTHLSHAGTDDALYGQLQAQFSPTEQVHLTMLIVIINGWNKINVGFRTPHPVPVAKG